MLAVAPAYAAAPVKDTYTASIVRGTGAYEGRHGLQQVELLPSGSGRIRNTYLRLRPLPCPYNGPCLQLAGLLHGSLSRRPREPGHGTPFRITAGGRLQPLGEVTVKGTVTGTGSTRGRVTIKLTITGPRGSVAVRGSSRRVAAHTAP